VSPRKLVILGLCAALAIGAAVWRNGVADQAELAAQHLATASASMGQLNEADAAFPEQFRASISSLVSSLLFNPSAAAKTVRTTVVPELERYVAILDRAVADAEVVIADTPNDTVVRNVEKIRKRGRGLHAARDRLAALPDKIDAGMSSDAISSELVGVGMALIIAP
jgi:hypothetical protein